MMANKSWTVSLNGETLHTEVSENLTYEFPRNCSSKDSKNYVVIATDSNGCTGEKTVTVRGNNCTDATSTQQHTCEIQYPSEWALNGQAFSVEINGELDEYWEQNENIGNDWYTRQVSLTFDFDFRPFGGTRQGGSYSLFCSNGLASLSDNGQISDSKGFVEKNQEFTCTYMYGNDCDTYHITKYIRYNSGLGFSLIVKHPNYGTINCTHITQSGYEDVNLDGQVEIWLYHPTTHKEIGTFSYWRSSNCNTMQFYVSLYK